MCKTSPTQREPGTDSLEIAPDATLMAISLAFAADEALGIIRFTIHHSKRSRFATGMGTYIRFCDPAGGLVQIPVMRSEVRRSGSLPVSCCFHAHPALTRGQLGHRRCGTETSALAQRLECKNATSVTKRTRVRWQSLATPTSPSFMAQPILHCPRCTRP
jgi:hypothetical protein